MKHVTRSAYKGLWMARVVMAKHVQTSYQYGCWSIEDQELLGHEPGDSTRPLDILNLFDDNYCHQEKQSGYYQFKSQDFWARPDKIHPSRQVVKRDKSDGKLVKHTKLNRVDVSYTMTNTVSAGQGL